MYPSGVLHLDLRILIAEEREETLIQSILANQPSKEVTNTCKQSVPDDAGEESPKKKGKKTVWA